MARFGTAPVGGIGFSGYSGLARLAGIAVCMDATANNPGSIPPLVVGDTEPAVLGIIVTVATVLLYLASYHLDAGLPAN